MKFRVLAIGLLAFLFAGRAQAIENDTLYLGLGAFSHGMGVVSGSSTGDTAFFGTFYFPVVASMSFGIDDGWSLAPTIGYTALPRKSPDGSQSTSYFMFSLPLMGEIGEGDANQGFDWGLGPGLLIYTIQGNGGTVLLNNGSGTSPFELPGGSSSAKTLTLNFGIGYNQPAFRVALDAITEGLLSNSRRTISLMLSVNFKTFRIGE